MVSRELLSAHKTVARFDGLTERKCFHRTALCPDQCDHGGTIGTFSIQKVVQNTYFMHINFKFNKFYNITKFPSTILYSHYSTYIMRSLESMEMKKPKNTMLR